MDGAVLMDLDDAIAKIETLTVAPDEWVVLHVARPLDMAQMESLKQQMVRTLKTQRVMVLGPDMEITKVEVRDA